MKKKHHKSRAEEFKNETLEQLKSEQLAKPHTAIRAKREHHLFSYE